MHTVYLSLSLSRSLSHAYARKHTPLSYQHTLRYAHSLSLSLCLLLYICVASCVFSSLFLCLSLSTPPLSLLSPSLFSLFLSISLLSTLELHSAKRAFAVQTASPSVRHTGMKLCCF